ncbi:Ser/Thr protein kinase RdoA (MazF antagonist) [Pedobacter cryoconitis]|uniref:Ser/Thr protein kinase RdoA (MazF antagonist) n=1 Tax=Pedobacter cryoconitis TaxID=188932 RepID=A0A7W9DX79_9SPHI|nr:aminoglycoside phosphotransferase family protein [Pedobacter cryoconitis]MBB5634583.1 Ser/Thr protein kinase RdoA (MazF antagonist) [Pedobacter cryoconitis]MBB6272287.1 Ser/Thr protein kinase RdoA (MazF antagonist) [Pedobacter cryoconitis]
MFDQILPLYGIQPVESDVQLFGDGLINRTWKVTHQGKGYILQQVNQSVFKKPHDIDQNISALKSYLSKTHPEYLFVSPLQGLSGQSLIETPEGYFRLFPFVENSHSLNVLNKKEEAYEGARQFGRFSKLLNDFDVKQLHITLPDFHNLTLRFEQFANAVTHASGQRKEKAKDLIAFIMAHMDIVTTYKNIVERNEIPLRVIHHDTKINNVLFDQQNKGICVIDLDTVMPGYFISDAGDMMRTYLSSANEEETDLKKVNVRKDFFKAIYDGYMEEMGDVLTPAEKNYFIYAGKFLIYMQAIRFLADYLQNDIYYGEKYEGHNLNRTKNQVTLLEKYLELEPELEEVIGKIAIQ